MQAFWFVYTELGGWHTHMVSKYLPLIFLLIALALGAAYFFSGDGTEVTEDESRTETETENTPPVQSAPKSSAPAPQKETRIFENGTWVTVITYTADGFSPSALTLNAGDEVRFVNKTSLTMRIEFTKAGAPSDIYGISQDSSVGKGGTYQVALLDKGIWSFHNLNGNTSLVGVITVK